MDVFSLLAYRFFCYPAHSDPRRTPLRIAVGIRPAWDSSHAIMQAIMSRKGWSEKHFFKKVQGVNVSKVALWYQNTVYKTWAGSVRCKDPRKIVEVLEIL